MRTSDPFGSTSTGRALYVEVNSPGPLDRQSPASHISFPMISGACQGVPHSASQAESGPPVAEVDADNRMYTGLMDLEEDIRQHVLSNLPNKSKFNQDLAAKDASELLIIYGNGFNIQIETLPLDGRITLRIASEKSE